jgi:cytochrome c oxidase cbb3-type subunit 4
MSEAWGHVAGVFTLLIMMVFIGIWIWAWLPRHRGTFGRLAHLPMEDGDAAANHSVPADTDGECR